MSEIKLINLPYQTSLVPFFQSMRDLAYPALFDSNHEHFADTRYDILVASPIARIRAHYKMAKAVSQIEWRDQPLYSLNTDQSPFALLDDLMKLVCREEWAQNAPKSLPFCGGLMGYYGYESGHFLEKLPDTVEHDIRLDTLNLGLYGWAVISDHQEATTQLMVTPWCPEHEEQDILQRLQTPSTEPAPSFQLRTAFQSNMTADQYLEKFNKVQDYIRAGDCYQVNLAQRFSSQYVGDPLEAYLSLRTVCPTPFAAYMELEKGQSILSHSPERFLLCDKGTVQSKPIKGTIARGETPEQDQANADWLCNSSKDKAENLMIVDLLRNDLGRTCLTGSIKVPKLFDLESYANVHHLVSTVEGKLERPEQGIHCFHQSFPGGSITGAPKIRAMEIIDELEPHQRSAYCGSIAYFSANGQMDSSITIRTLVADQGQLHCWAGGGLVADSSGESEYQETFTKVGKLTHTLEQRFLQ
ncbi:aminodeoxychorismate synthase component I [Marinomonas epiphytica]